MANPVPPKTDGPLVAGQYLIERQRPLQAVGGLLSFAVTDKANGRSDLMAVQFQHQFPPRARMLQLLSVSLDGLLTPLAWGAVGDACYGICMVPPGPNLLARPRPWSEVELLECVLRPAAHVLEHMQERGATHRGIRADNVFHGAPGQPVVLGVAWAAPPAMAQPALFEPPYSAMCLPAGRGDGSIADDVYSLGVLLLCLALGRVPLARLDDEAIVRRKLEMGTYTALAGDERLPPIIGDLVRGMLAEDPEHRPTPKLLLDPASARGRRVAARPPRRAQRSIAMAGNEIWDARSLAHAMAVEPDQGLNALRGGSVEQWLRRGLGDGQLAARIEELVRHRPHDPVADKSNDAASLVMRAIALLDPLAPLCWRGIAIWPDGIGPALASAMGSDPDVAVRLEEIITHEETSNWASLRQDRCDFAVLRVEARQYRGWLQQLGQESGLPRVAYLLNSMMPCSSPLLAGHWVVRLNDVLPAMEVVAARIEQKQTEPIDTHIAAFVSARLERRVAEEAVAGSKGSVEARYIAQLRLLAQLQARNHGLKVPALAAWLAARAGPLLATWHNRERRAAVGDKLHALAGGGHLVAMLAVLEDPVARGMDAREAQAAAEQLGRIDAELAQISADTSSRASLADRVGQEIAAGFGLIALATVLLVAALG